MLQWLFFGEMFGADPIIDIKLVLLLVPFSILLTFQGSHGWEGRRDGAGF